MGKTKIAPVYELQPGGFLEKGSINNKEGGGLRQRFQRLVASLGRGRDRGESANMPPAQVLSAESNPENTMSQAQAELIVLDIMQFLSEKKFLGVDLSSHPDMKIEATITIPHDGRDENSSLPHVAKEGLMPMDQFRSLFNNVRQGVKDSQDVQTRLEKARTSKPNSMPIDVMNAIRQLDPENQDKYNQVFDSFSSTTSPDDGQQGDRTVRFTDTV